MGLPRWLQIVESIAPLILAATPAAPLIPFIMLGVKTAEQIPGATGDQKLVLAKQIVNVGVGAVNAQAGHQEIDPAMVDQLSTDAINTVVGAVNLKHASTAEDVVEAPKV